MKAVSQWDRALDSIFLELGEQPLWFPSLFQKPLVQTEIVTMPSGGSMNRISLLYILRLLESLLSIGATVQC